MKRVIVLVHFASKLSREQMGATGLRVAQALRARLGHFAGVFTSDIAMGAVGTTDSSCSDLMQALLKDMQLPRGDNISVMELGMSVVTTHSGLSQWQGQTDFVAFLGGSGAQ